MTLNTRRLTLTAILAALAIGLSTLENLVPISAFIPIPGLRLGLSNLAVMAAVFLSGTRAGFAVAVLKVSVVFLTFGNVSSLVISSFGTALALLSLVISKRAYGRYISFIGVSAVSAVMHASGQVLGACILTGSLASTAILLPLGLCSMITGCLCGFIMNCVYPTLRERIRI